MSNQFFVLLPSDTPGYPENKPNKFRVHLPRTLKFEDNWVCGLHSIIYTNSWPSLGTNEEQWVKIYLKNSLYYNIPVPKGFYNSAEELERTLKQVFYNEARLIQSHIEKRISKRETNVTDQASQYWV